MSYVVYLKRSAERELDKLASKLHKQIVKRLLLLRENPRPKGVKKLLGREEYRIRIGDYRVLYLIHESQKKIEIVSIAHRREIYR